MESPVIDAHVHLWDTGRLEYPWLADAPTLNRPFLPAHYFAAAGDTPVDGLVFVQCECRPDQYMDELSWVLGLAAGEPRIAAAVPWVPLELGERARPALERMAGEPLVRGIRRIIEFEPDPEFCLRPDFIKGVRMLPGLGLRFDININDSQMENTLRMVRACPDVRFMLDHAAKPDIAGGGFDRWARCLREFSRHEGMYCKLSHFYNRAGGNRTLADLRPYAEHVFECFGADRVCFASDFPVVNTASSFGEWKETVQALTRGLSRRERSLFFHDNAQRFYGLAGVRE